MVEKESLPLETQILVKLEGIDGKLVNIETKIDSLAKESTDHESRIRKLEKTIYYATGAAAVLGGVIGNVLGTGVI